MEKPKIHRIIPVVDALLTDGARILFIRRTKEPFRDKLVLPGGHVEGADKSLEAACQREVREEVGLDIALNRFKDLCLLSTPGRDPRPGNEASQVYHVLLTTKELDMARPGSDAREIVLHNMRDDLSHATIGFDHADAIEYYYELMQWLESLEEDDGWPGY